MRATGIVITDTQFADRDGNEINGRLGARVKATETLAFRGAVYTGFRVPTLNELYRPFRVGNDITNANPELKPEHLLGGEVAAEWQATETFRSPGPLSSIGWKTLSATSRSVPARAVALSGSGKTSIWSWRRASKSRRNGSPFHRCD